MKANKIILLSLVLGLFFTSALVAQSLNDDQVKKEDQSKKDWIEENQGEYRSQGGQTGAILEINSKTNGGNQFSKSSNSEAVPEFNTKAEKEEWFITNSATITKDNSQEAVQEPKRTETKERVLVFPDDETFPVYAKTGDKALDDDNYAQQKQEWINNNPAKYAKMSNPTPNKDMSAEEKKERKTVNQTNNK